MNGDAIHASSKTSFKCTLVTCTPARTASTRRRHWRRNGRDDGLKMAPRYAAIGAPPIRSSTPLPAFGGRVELYRVDSDSIPPIPLSFLLPRRQLSSFRTNE
ncbi:hypothetical protein MTO96_046434 [Rhipicephalus appendiculatus]